MRVRLESLGNNSPVALHCMGVMGIIPYVCFAGRFVCFLQHQLCTHTHYSAGLCTAVAMSPHGNKTRSWYIISWAHPHAVPVAAVRFLGGKEALKAEASCLCLSRSSTGVHDIRREPQDKQTKYSDVGACLVRGHRLPRLN